MGPKKGKKKKDVAQEIVPIYEEPPPPEEEQEEVQYTETSYTSASWEDVPPLPLVEEPKIKKKKKKKGEEEVKQEASGMIDWSAESLPEEPAPEPVIDPLRPGALVPPRPPEKKEKKKGKGKGKAPKDDIPEFEKPANWKAMDQKQRDKWLKDRIEEWRQQVEAEKQARLAEAKVRRVREASERAALAVRDAEEMAIRRNILLKTCRMMDNFDAQKRDYDNKKQMKEEWEQYLKCDGLPDPRVVTQMATYLYVWKDRGLYDDDDLDKRFKEILPMLEMLEQFVANARLYTARQANNYNEIRLQLRAQLALAIELASYSVLRNLENKLKWQSVKLCTYQRVFEGLKLNLWVAIKMPTSRPIPPKPDDIKIPVELEFPGIKVSVTLPTIIESEGICVRASKSMIDLLSESTRSYPLKMEMYDRYQDLFVFNVKEYVDVCKKKEEQDVYRKAFFRAIRERTRELENIIKTNIYAPLIEEKAELEALMLAEPPVPLPDPRVWCGNQNELRFKKFLKTNAVRSRPGELNLRKFRICGGVLYLDLLINPPQMKNMERGIELTRLELPKTLRWVDYKVQYRTPAPTPGVIRTPEEILIEMKKIELEYEKLALVFIHLPRDVIWNEPPQVMQWQEQRKLWTNNYINDFKYNEERQTVQFRTGVIWPIGIATVRYSNMPYQGWDVRPDTKGKGVVVTVTGMSVTGTWKIQGNYVRLMFVANASPALRPHYGKKYSVKRMVQVMREGSCDFFPDFDAHNYVEGSCPKEWAMERHLYHCMAFLSRAYNFQWSRWNVEQGFRKIVIQFREAIDPKREAKLTLLTVTPQYSLVLRRNENMPEWCEDPMMGMQFYPDLFTLNLSYGSLDARRAAFKMKFKPVETLFLFLQELKLCSFS